MAFPNRLLPYGHKPKLQNMYMTYDQLRQIKHSLPTGSIKKIAAKLNLEEQTVRNYFGAQKFEDGNIANLHRQSGPNGGIVNIGDESILQEAQNILKHKN